MKTLRAFWHWVDNDKPTEIRRDKLSKVALVALCMAESQVASRAFGDGSSWSTMSLWFFCSSGDGSNPNERPEFFRPELVAAVRDLSLAICPALEAMHAAVPEAPPPPPMDFRREYLGKWAEQPRMNFTGRMLLRDYHEPRPIFLPPAQYERLRQELESGEYESVKVATEDGLVPLPEPRVDCFHCDQSFPESQIDQHGKECRQRTLKKFQQMAMAPRPMLTPVPCEQQQPLKKCCVSGDHSFSWRQRIEPCRYCGEPVREPTPEQRNEYEQRGQALQAVDATHPRNLAYSQAMLNTLYGPGQ